MSALLVDEREYAGLRVSLKYENSTLYLVTVDLGTDEECTLEIDPAQARDAFEHPGAYGVIRCKCATCSPPVSEDESDDEYLPDKYGALATHEDDDDEDIPFA